MNVRTSIFTGNTVFGMQDQAGDANALAPDANGTKEPAITIEYFESHESLQEYLREASGIFLQFLEVQDTGDEEKNFDDCKTFLKECDNDTLSEGFIKKLFDTTNSKEWVNCPEHAKSKLAQLVKAAKGIGIILCIHTTTFAPFRALSLISLQHRPHMQRLSK